MSPEQNKKTALASFRLIETGDSDLAREIIADDFVNREAMDDPDQADRNLKGSAGFLATSAWLRAAFADLSFEDLETLAENDWVVVQATMTGRHVPCRPPEAEVTRTGLVIAAPLGLDGTAWYQ
jgi:ketosteroid isomerase-like protein